MIDNSYRSIFHSPALPAEAFAAARDELRAWLGSKRYDLDAFDRGDSRIAVGVTLLYTAANSPDGAQTRNWRLRENADGGDWAVSLTVHGPADPSDKAAVTWFWTEVEFVPEPGGQAGGGSQRAGVPRLVRALLDRVDALDGSATLADKPVIVSADRVGELIDVLCDPDRRLPAAVAATNSAVSLDDWQSTISRVTRDITGLASVYLLGPLGTDAFNRAIGESHAVWGGALRTYLPDVDPAVAADGARHRVLSAGRIMATPAASARIISGVPRRLALEMPLPAALGGVSRTLLSQASSTSDAADVTTLRAHVEHLGQERDLALDLAADEQERASALFGERESALAQLAEREQQVLELENRVRALRRQLSEAGKILRTDITGDIEEVPPADFAELIDWAERTLSHLTFTGDIEFPLQLDASPESATWVRSSWEAFRALQSYAETKAAEGFRGDFKAWCERPPSADAYVIPSGRVKQRESGTVQNNKKWWQERLFPVPRELDADGREYMEAHIVIGASSAGHINPRLYYLDATVRARQVYVGYLGRHLTNTLT
jgi:ribosomal protein S18